MSARLPCNGNVVFKFEHLKILELKSNTPPSALISGRPMIVLTATSAPKANERINGVESPKEKAVRYLTIAVSAPCWLMEALTLSLGAFVATRR